MTSRRKAWAWSFLTWFLLCASALYPVVEATMSVLVVGTLGLGLLYGALRWLFGDISLWWAGTRRVRRRGTDG